MKKAIACLICGFGFIPSGKGKVCSCCKAGAAPGALASDALLYGDPDYSGTLAAYARKVDRDSRKT
jgi:hypothetical protein